MLLACHHCATLHRLAPLAEGARAGCTACGSILYRHRSHSIERTLAWTVAALTLFLVAHAFPFMTLEIEGRAQTTTLLTGPIQLWKAGMWPLALVVLAAATIFPLLKLTAQLWVLAPLHFGMRARLLGPAFRFVQLLHPWAMMEVYLLGVIVAYVKLTDLATIELDIALFAFVALIVSMIAAEASLEPHEVWERLQAQAAVAGRRIVPAAGLVSCHACGQVVRSLANGDGQLCPRCDAPLHRRKPDSIARTWALLATATILYVPANLLPIMTVTRLGRGEPDTILSGIKALFAAGMWPIALLVFFASIVVPVMKLAGLAFLLVTVQRGSIRGPRDRTLIYRIIEGIGRWSMVDIFMIAILVSLVDLGAIATIEPGAGAVSFAAVVVITMLASMSFDSRLIWDAAMNGNERVVAPRV